MSPDNKTEEPNDGRVEIWKAASNHAREKLMVGFISLAMIVFAAEAIRVVAVTALSGLTPQVFGLMPTRQLAALDCAGIIALALAGIGFVGFHLLRLALRGLPGRLWLLEKVGGEGESDGAGESAACLVVEYDGAFRPVRHFFFADITEIDSITRGTISGGGHQVRLRVRDHRVARTIARFDTAAEAERLVRRLNADRSRICGLDADLEQP